MQVHCKASTFHTTPTLALQLAKTTISIILNVCLSVIIPLHISPSSLGNWLVLVLVCLSVCRSLFVCLSQFVKHVFLLFCFVLFLH